MVSKIIRVLLFLGSALAVVVFALVSSRLMSSAHPLDPVEVAVLERAEAFAHGGPMYAEPVRLDDPAMMPGFPLAVAPLVQAYGAEVWQPRAVALLCMLLIALLIMTITFLETTSWTLAVTSVGFLALGFNLLAAPPGVARPELLMLVFALLGFLALRLTNGIMGAMLGALFAAAAFYTEPQAVWFIAAAIFALSLEDRPRLLTFSLGLAVLVGGGYVWLSRMLGPWFNFSVWGDPMQALRWNPSGPLHYVGDDLLGKLGVLTLATVLSFALPIAPWRGKGGMWVCMGMAALAAGLISTQTTAFGTATLVPSLIVLALVGPISMQRVTGHLSAWPGSTRMSGHGVVLTALALQFIMFFACSQTAWKVTQ